jgi:site-specific DNA-methyltransferase (adenine-specific)
VQPYFQDNGFKLYQADCIGFLREMPAASVDMIFADPPYNLSKGGFTCHAGRRAPVDKGTWDESRGMEGDFAFHSAWIRECRRVLRDSGSLWVSGTYHSIYACGYALMVNGYHILNDICWYKPNAPPNLSARYFTASHETLIWARKSQNARHTFNYAMIKNGPWEEDALKRPGKQMRSVWSIPTPGPGEKSAGRHPTQKPFHLLRRVILASTQEGDLVLDPFTGSSTTGLAAVTNRRRFIGIDTDAGFLDLSVQRYRSLKESVGR